MTGEKTFSINIDGAVMLGLEEIWPNRDHPENPTAADVATLMEKAGYSAVNLIEEWNLPVKITVDGHPVNLR